MTTDRMTSEQLQEMYGPYVTVVLLPGIEPIPDGLVHFSIPVSMLDDSPMLAALLVDKLASL